jgi:hypothetical protein
MDDYFNKFLQGKGFAPAFDAIPVGAATLEYYKGKVPDRLLGYWKEYGFCGFGEGLLWLTNPKDYEELVEQWLGQTHLWGKGNFYVFARTAFGELYIYSTEGDGEIIIDPHSNTILPCDFPSPPPTKEFQERGLGIFIKNTDKKDPDYYDKTDKLLFKRCLKKLRRLANDEMYTFVPALALGGIADIEHVQKVKIHEQLSLLASLDTPTVMKSTTELFGKI